ncbi:hypothetical protein, partial [Bacillus alveayuensis]|uniref:hypothetical protein n=1 Tax=Aeribacillus alveayuensis TaxID=279215 RepID=UPI0005CCAB31
KQLSERLDNLENGQKQLSERLDNLENSQKQLNERLDSLEQGQKEIRFELVELKKGQEQLQKNLIDSLGAYTEKIVEYVDDKTSALNKRVYAVETDIQRILRL